MIPLKLRVDNHVVQAWWLDKWRTLVRYQGRTYPPGDRTVNKALKVFRANSGIGDRYDITPIWIE